MKTEKEIKQMAEAKALEKYPEDVYFDDNGFKKDYNKLKREFYAQAIIDTYKEQHEHVCEFSVNGNWTKLLCDCGKEINPPKEN